MRTRSRLLQALMAVAWVGQSGAVAQTASDSGYTIAQPITGKAIPCVDGHIKIFPCQNVELLSYLPMSAMGGAGRYDIWGWTDSATHREFALVGGEAGVAFVEVTDAVHPKYLGLLPFHGQSRGPAGVKVYRNYALVVVAVGENEVDNGMQVFDLTQLRDVKNAPAEFHETVRYDGFTSSHTLALNPASGFAYATGNTTCGSGLHMIDMRTPTKPTFAGCYGDVGYIHDSQCVLYHGPDTRYHDHEICFSAAIKTDNPPGEIAVVDVTDKQHPKKLGAGTYPSAVLVHQGWLTTDQRYFFVDDEFDEMFGGQSKTRTIVFNMTKLDDPVVALEYQGTTNASDHNLYINGRYMYQSNYAAGLRIVDVADPKQPKEVGFLDTAPDLTGPGMQLGTWGNYPFFANGVVAVASNGLFLVRRSSH